MADINIIRIEELGDCVARTIAQINAGVLAANQSGILAKLPEFVDFSAVVVIGFQTLPMRGGETSESSQKETGTGKMGSKSIDHSQKGGTSTDTESVQANTHEERNAENIRNTTQD